MKTLITTMFFTLVIVTQTAFARSWDKIQIPGAFCGDGQPYYVFVDKENNNQNLLIELMGGGVCWSKDTCNGVDPHTWLHHIPEVPEFSYMTGDFWGWSNHPFVNDSALYFPYCTGDVFAADHTAQYDDTTVIHDGRRVVTLAFAYLQAKKTLPFKKYKRVTMWGASAGAIGAMIHLKTAEPYFSPNATKLAVIDSAGLHFGKDFWHKFTPAQLTDFHQTFGAIGLNFSDDDGFVAPLMGPVFTTLSNWKLAFLQSTEDIIMSTVFGDISPEDHKKLVLSDQGLPAIAKSYSNVSTWISDSSMHTFLLLKASSYMENTEDQSAINYVNDFVSKNTPAK